MSLLESVNKYIETAKEEAKIKSITPMDELLAKPEVKEAARKLNKQESSQKIALESLNRILEEQKMLPIKDDVPQKIGPTNFRKLLPKSRKSSSKK